VFAKHIIHRLLLEQVVVKAIHRCPPFGSGLDMLSVAASVLEN